MGTINTYIVFVSRDDGANIPFYHYDNEEAANAHRDHLNSDALEHHRKVLGCSGAFVRNSTSVVRKHFPAMDKKGLRTLLGVGSK